MSATPVKILLTGATGYIGGTILSTLLKSPTLSNAKITTLVRGSDRASKLSSTYGDRVNPVLFRDIDDLEATTAAAAQHDIVINTMLGFHPTSAEALVKGLAQRKASTGRDVWMIHTSGTSNLADSPITGVTLDREFDDEKDDIYGYEKEREAEHPYPQRTAELGVVDAGLELGVKTLIIMSPTIYGIGTGLFNNLSMQIPMYIRGALGHGRAIVVGEGKGIWDHVHVEDLAELYQLAVLEVQKDGGKALPSGKKGIIFSGNGRHAWKDVAQGVADALHEKEVIKDRTVDSVSIEEAVEIIKLPPELAGDGPKLIEGGLCSNSRTVSSVGRKLGWSPTRGEEAWRENFRTDVKAALEKQ